MIGSETFIMVALRWTEKSTSSALALATCWARKASSAAAEMKVPSTTSPSSTFSPSLRIVSVPSAPTCLMVSSSAAGSTIDFSLLRKSLTPIVATFVLLSEDQAPIECGWLRA